MLVQALNLRQPNSSQALVLPRNNHELQSVFNYGDWLRSRVTQVLTARLQHHNRDGSWFTPRVIDSVTLRSQSLGEYLWHVVVIDPQALYHFSKEEMLKQEMLDALTAAVSRPVVGFAYLTGAAIEFKRGIVYAIALKPQSLKVNAETRLPKTVILNTNSRTDAQNRLLVPLGVSARGEEWKPLGEIGHALITGTTGAGKSTWLHSALAALLTQNTPAHLRVALIDPKRSELTPWVNAPHVFGKIANTTEQAGALLEDVVTEMDHRGELFAGALCRDITSFNARAAAKDKLPYLLVVVDECLDLILTAGQRGRVANALRSIAVRGRSAGIVLWAATQHASAIEGLPRVVNVNLGTRLVFRVSDANAARSAGCVGAQLIPPTIPGRMMVKLSAEPVMMQSYYLSDDALLAVARSVAGTAKPEREWAQPELDLSEQERTLVAWAMEKNEGRVSLAAWQQFGIGHREARRRLAVWQERGWIVKSPKQRNSWSLADTFKQAWQIGKFGKLGSLAAETPNTPPSTEGETAKPLPELLIDVDDPELAATHVCNSLAREWRAGHEGAKTSGTRVAANNSAVF